MRSVKPIQVSHKLEIDADLLQHLIQKFWCLKAFILQKEKVPFQK